ncbi:MAG: hypothetical protein AB1391_02565 [Candidatus Micrarchaeota archaeon]
MSRETKCKFAELINPGGFVLRWKCTYSKINDVVPECLLERIQEGQGIMGCPYPIFRTKESCPTKE